MALAPREQAGRAPHQVGGAEPQRRGPCWVGGSPSTLRSPRRRGRGAGRRSQAVFIFGFNLRQAAQHLNASSSFLRPRHSPPPRAAPRFSRFPRSHGFPAGGPPPPPPSSLRSDSVRSRRQTPQRGRSPAPPLLRRRLSSSTPRIIYCPPPSLLPSPFPAVVHSAQEKRGKERKRQHKGGVSRGDRGGLRTRSSAPERSAAGPRRPGWMELGRGLAGSSKAGGRAQDAAFRRAALTRCPNLPGLQSVAIDLERRWLPARPGRLGVWQRMWD